MPRSFLVKKYLKQKYDEDQIKLQQQQQQQQQEEQQKQQQQQQELELQQAIRNHHNQNNSNHGDNNSVLIISNPGTKVAEGTHQDKSHVVTSLVSSSMKSHVTPLSVRMTNGYIQDLTHLHMTSRVAQMVDHTKVAVIPQNDHEVAAIENYHTSQHYQHHSNLHHQAPRRSVIVTNNNHPANRYHDNTTDNLYGNYDVIHSPGLPSEHEQNAPYDYSIRKEDKESNMDSSLAPSSPKRFKSQSASSSPAPAHTASSPVTVLYPHLPSPPPAHQGIDSATASVAATASPNSPRGSPPHEGLPADHPFHHPLIQQLINQRLHVPGESDNNDDRNDEQKSNNTDSVVTTKDEGSVYSHHHDHHDHHHHHHHNLQHHRQYYHYNHETTREDEVKELSSSSPSSSTSPSHSLTTTTPPHDPEPTDYPHSHPHHHQHHHNHHHQVYQSQPPPPSSSGYSTILTPSHLPPLQSYPHPHSFPPSPSPTIPSSSPTLPNTESKSFFILPPPSSPDSIPPPSSPPSSSPASSPELNLTIASSPKPNTQNLVHPPTSSSPNAYTYEAFLISDGRSRKRSFDESSATSEESETKSQNGRVRYTCNECGKDYATSSNLSRHKQTHRALDSKSAKKCPHCDKVYVSMPALSMHILTHDLKHACDVCGKTFSRPWLLQGHMRSHTGEKPFGCAHCGKAFADRSNLRAHMQTHSAFKHFACNKCNKTFALKSYLNKHLESSCVKVE